MNQLPNFLIIGAMKCATSTLHEQLAQQPGICMSTPKEPCFFSDDDQWRRGVSWYKSLFAGSAEEHVRGESSTHYTKLPTYPETVQRIKNTLGSDTRFIYIMRDPVDRLVSQYIHEWSQGIIAKNVSIDQAVVQHPELVDYSRYAYQLQPYIEYFGRSSILPVFFEHFVAHEQATLARVCAFIGYEGSPQWVTDFAQRNASSERMRRNTIRDAILGFPGVRASVRALVPQAMRHRIMRTWTMQHRPQLSSETRENLVNTFNKDLQQLGEWFNLRLNCETFREVAQNAEPNWSEQANEVMT